MGLHLIHIHARVLIGASHIADSRLFKDAVREFIHLVLHFLNQCLSLLLRHHPHNSKNIGIYTSCLRRQICLDLILDLLCHVTSGLKSGGEHHGALKNIFQGFHLIFIIRDRIFQHISLFRITAVVCVVCLQHRLLILLRNKKQKTVHLLRGDHLRNLILDSSLLDSDIYNVRSVSRKRQITVSLNEQNDDDRQHGFPLCCRVLE